MSARRLATASVQGRRRVRRMHRVAGLSSAVFALTLLATAPGVVATGETMRLLPPLATVAGGETFTLTVVHETAGATSGAQATLTFDPAVLQVVSVERAPSYAAAPVLVPTDIAAAVSSANGTGTLAGIATAFLPPASVAPGVQDYLVVTFRAIGCGTSEVGLPAGPADATLLDGSEGAYGSSISVAAAGAMVTIDCGAGAPTGAVEGATSSATGTPGPAEAPIAATDDAGVFGGGSMPLLAALVALAVGVAAAFALRRRRA